MHREERPILIKNQSNTDTREREGGGLGGTRKKDREKT